MSFLVIKKNSIISFLFFISYLFCILSDIFYFQFAGSSVSYFFILHLPVLLLLFFLYPKVLTNNIFVVWYLWFFVIIVFSVLGAFLYSNIGLLAQMYIYIFIPIIFFYFGYLVSFRFLFWINGFFISVCFFFSVGQFLFFNYGLDGPLGLFEFLTLLINKSQIGLGVEEIGARATGFFVNPNILGFFSGLSFFFFLITKKYLKEQSIFSIIFIFLSLLCVMLSISRTSMVGLFIGYCVILFYSFKQGNKIESLKGLLGSFFAVSLSVFLMFKFSSDYYLERTVEIGNVANQGAEGSGNLSGRLNAWINLIDYVTLNPFGTIIPPQLAIEESPDSQFIYFLTQGGITLLIVFLILLLSILFIFKKTKSEYFLAVFMFVLISCLTFVSFNSFVISLFWLMIGLCFKMKDSRC